MVAFRNTGIEGGYGSLATQNWLLARRRDQQRYSKITGEKVSLRHATGKGYGPPIKQLPKLKGFRTDYIPYLLRYADGPYEPEKHGSSSVNRQLAKYGLIQCVNGPHSFSSKGETFGDTYLLTRAGREYVDALRSRGDLMRGEI